jgi:hypothetical protein
MYFVSFINLVFNRFRIYRETLSRFSCAASAKGEGADVHAPQGLAGERTLLVLAVGGLHLQRIGHERSSAGSRR